MTATARDAEDPREQSATIAYVRFVVATTGMSPSALARAAGIATTTLTRPLNNPKYKFALSATTLEKIAKISGISPAPFFENDDTVSQKLATFYDTGVYDEGVWGPGSDSVGEEGRSTLLLGSVAAGRWLEVGIEEFSVFSLNVTIPTAAPRNCFLVQVSDLHLAPAAHPTDFLLCLRMAEFDLEKLYLPTVAIVERKSEDGRLVERTALRLSTSKAGFQLSAICRRPEFRSHHFELPTLPGTDDLRVIGIAELAVRTLSAP